MSIQRPAGTVTFLFTDIEGSTGRWEQQTAEMGEALARHDATLRTAIEAHGGWLFKHTGDGVVAAFASPQGAVDAAVDAQRALALPVRMGLATGEAELRGDDYFGPALNRAARVMAAGHGGQVLVANSTAGLLQGIDLLDLGERRLRDLSGTQHLFQVRAEGLRETFPPLRTLDATPGNLRPQATSFIGRKAEVDEIIAAVRENPLVTLTGVGGVGKTRLALQVAGALVPEFPGGVWFVELAPIGDPDAVPGAVATALGLTPQAGKPVAERIAEALAGRRLLVVLDNCEHVLGAAADLVEAILAGSSTVRVVATSREGLRLGAEHLWPVPSLGLAGGATSEAVKLFVERARVVNPGFALQDAADFTALEEICRRLDGIPLAIELATARMVSMSVQDVRDRLGDRFRLLAGSRRGLERHQTLRHAVQWSYELLNDDERTVLNRCAVFAGGFDVAGVTHLCDGFDEYAALDLLDSLVRKSLITVAHAGGHARYGMLETIRQFAEDQLAATGAITQVRDHHARYFAEQAMAHFTIWDGPRQHVAIDWVDVEFDNLRAGFRWAADQGDLVTATAIAAHTVLLAWALLRYEPLGWAEEILEAAGKAGIPQLPRLYTAASFCSFVGDIEAAIGYAQAAFALEADPRYSPFELGWSSYPALGAHFFAGRVEPYLRICTELTAQPGLAHVIGLCGTLYLLPPIGRAEEAILLAPKAVAAARASGNPYWVAWALLGYGRAFAQGNPTRALAALRQALVFAQDNGIPYFAALSTRDAAGLEVVHGDIDQGLVLFDAAIDSFHRAGNVTNLATTFASLAVFFKRVERPELAATLYGASTRYGTQTMALNESGTVDHVRALLGEAEFDRHVAAGAAMEPGDAVQYAHEQIQLAREALAAASVSG